MEISDIRITEENHAQFDKEWDVLRREEQNKILDLNGDINDYLDSVLGNRNDWGGVYATFLAKIGIDFQTDNGWWSLAAIHHKNLEYFVKHYTSEDDDFIDEYTFAVEKYNKLREMGFLPAYNFVDKAVEKLNNL